ncbi:phosphohydrolase [Lachnospiraceae bacterium NSJ-143]|nr:phosphohydrolase [Lachnospiraceae bacterium NSJ-143]
MNDYITTYTKKHINPLSPQPEDIDIRDIAHALSMMVRANGHFPEFYSVCQHSIHCCEEALCRNMDKNTALLCLLHDASEAYIADIIRPVKRHIPQYIDIEKGIQNAVFLKYAKKVPESAEYSAVKEIDDALLYYEFLHFAGEKISETVPAIKSSPDFSFIPPAEAEKKFLSLFTILS